MTDTLDLAAMRAAAERLIAANAAMDPPPRLHKKAMEALYERDDARRAWWDMVHDPARALALLDRLERAEAVLRAAGWQFALYAEQHWMKGTDDGNAKAKVNDEWAQVCLAAAQGKSA